VGVLAVVGIPAVVGYLQLLVGWLPAFVAYLLLLASLLLLAFLLLPKFLLFLVILLLLSPSSCCSIKKPNTFRLSDLAYQNGIFCRNNLVSLFYSHNLHF
jgi:hypothetical protein